MHIKKEVERVNQYEKRWRISTNQTKLKVIPINNNKNSRSELIIDGKRQLYADSGNFLGLEFSSTGYSKHINAKVAQAKRQLTKLERFSNLSQKAKRNLYLALVRPILEYPPVPLHKLTNNNIKKLQRVQNKATKFITNTRYPTIISSKDLHEVCNIQPMNQLLHRRAKAIWSSIVDKNYPMMNRMIQQENGPKSYIQFPTTFMNVNDQLPRPIY